MIPIRNYRKKLGVLGNSNFAVFLTATFLSNMGSALVPVALSFALFAKGAGTVGVSAVLSAEVLPMALLLLFGGVLADRYPPRRIMVAADLTRALTQTALAALLFQPFLSYVAVVPLSALLGLGNALDAPGRNRLLTQIVPSALLPSANSLIMMAISFAGLLGPAIGGLLVASIGAGWAVALDALSYLASAGLLLALTPKKGLSAEDNEPGMLTALREGWTAFAGRPWLWMMVCLFAVMQTLSWAPTEILGASIFSRQVHGASYWGFLLSAMGTGAMVGALMALRLRPKQPIRAVLLWLLIYPLTPACLAGSWPFWAQGLCFFLGGIEMANVNVVWESTLQRAVPPEMLSRVSAYDALGSFCLMPLGYVLAGPMALIFGTGGTLWLGAVIVMIFIVALLLFGRVQSVALADFP
ncbi:MFS transporter [Acetobacter fallax]|uniref:MFS transporter n=1 Tax=Acetobacter fallax TaxID=1737473 RepID=A0ABX0KEX4_9PROT|nr:MFS transporter [Acetobacter fallax]NHO33666.1 MFS transporter [Acetobacter fallax]NHO37254.1 MFS transporter [Acetobacter fallax]